MGGKRMAGRRSKRSGQAKDAIESDMAEETSSNSRGRVDATSLDPRVQERIGRQLKAYYDDIVKQPVPQHLIDLIEQLEKAEAEE